MKLENNMYLTTRSKSNLFYSKSNFVKILGPISATYRVFPSEEMAISCGFFSPWKSRILKILTFQYLLIILKWRGEEGTNQSPKLFFIIYNFHFLNKAKLLNWKMFIKSYFTWLSLCFKGGNLDPFPKWDPSFLCILN